MINTKEKIVNKDVKILLNEADTIIGTTIRNVNYEIINMYWNLGRMIAEYKANNDTKYGDEVVNKFSEELFLEYGKGFNRWNVYHALKFYELFSDGRIENEQKVALALLLEGKPKTEQKLQTPAISVRFPFDMQKSNKRGQSADFWKNVTWSHIIELLVIKDIKVFKFYLNETAKKSLTRDELRNFIKSLSYERTLSNQRKGTVRNKIEQTLKDPTILGIENKKRSEKELESDIVRNITSFMNEIGNNIFFRGTQYKININSLIYKVDIVLYDKDNKSYILVDLKINKVSRKDISQMQFYVEYFNKYIKENTDNNTVGIILCETKDTRVEESVNIYQIKYLNEIPEYRELLKIINANKIILLKTAEFII